MSPSGRGEGFLNFAHLGSLEVANLLRKALERRACDRYGAEEVGMPVAGHDLSGGALDIEPQAIAHVSLDVWRQLRVGADCARELAGGHPVAPSPEAVAAPRQLERPSCQFEPKGRGLGMDTMGTPGHERGRMLEGPRLDRLSEAPHALDEKIPCIPQGNGGRGVDDIGRGHAVMNMPACRSCVFSHVFDEGNHVVLSYGFDDSNAVRIERRPLFDLGEVVDGHFPTAHPGLHGQHLDFEPPGKLRALGEDR